MTYSFVYLIFLAHRYVDNINCLLYSFLADSHQIVEITFDEFDVQKTTIESVDQSVTTLLIVSIERHFLFAYE